MQTEGTHKIGTENEEQTSRAYRQKQGNEQSDTGRKVSAIRKRVGKLLQTCGYERLTPKSRWVGKAKNTSGILETVEENQDKISNAQSIKTRALESTGVSNEQKEVLEDVQGTIDCANK